MTAPVPSLPRRYWVEMSTREFDALPPDTIAVLPVAAVEQHGPHLPVAVDACLNEAVVRRAVTRLPAGLPVTFLPMQAVGKSNEHQAFAGTLTLSAETLIRVWTEIAESVLHAGVRKLVLFNSHGGQPQVMDIVARDLRARLGMLVVCASSYGLPEPDGLFPEQESRHGIHGGSKETSMMLALRPELVQMQHAQDFASLSQAMAVRYRFLAPEGAVGFGWQTQDLNPHGACGNALDADARRGELLLDAAADGLVALLGEVHDFALDQLRERS